MKFRITLRTRDKEDRWLRVRHDDTIVMTKNPDKASIYSSPRDAADIAFRFMNKRQITSADFSTMIIEEC